MSELESPKLKTAGKLKSVELASTNMRIEAKARSRRLNVSAAIANKNQRACKCIDYGPKGKRSDWFLLEKMLKRLHPATLEGQKQRAYLSCGELLICPCKGMGFIELAFLDLFQQQNAHGSDSTFLLTKNLH